jgi:hypothetical protein
MSDEHQGSQTTHLQPPFLHVPNVPAAPPPQPMHQLLGQQTPPNPLLQQAFVAWLQYMHLQTQLQQQQHLTHPPQAPLLQQPAQHQQQQTQSPNVPFSQTTFAISPTETTSFSREAFSTEQTIGQSNESPSPEVDQGDGEEVGASNIAEEKRRRNTAASGKYGDHSCDLTPLTPATARFRVKKKQWTLNLERSITDLSGRVEELEREAAELRRENGWLKEIVMLKSKRYGGPAPNLDGPPAQAGPSPETSNESSVAAKYGDSQGQPARSLAGSKGKERSDDT